MGDKFCQWVLSRVPPPVRWDGDGPPPVSQEINVILKKGNTTAGRAASNTIPIPSVLSSRRHCSIVLKHDGSLFITDHKSLNGTYVQGTTIPTERALALTDGDLIGLGVDPFMDPYENDIPPEKQFVFKITRKQLHKDQLASCDPNTVVPVLDDPSYSCNTSSQSNINQPSTSDNDITYQKNQKETVSIVSSKSVETPQNLSVKKSIEVVNVESSDEEDVIKLTDENVTVDKSMSLCVVPNKKSKLMPNNVITIDNDSDNDLPILGPESGEETSSHGKIITPSTAFVKHGQSLEHSAERSFSENIETVENDSIIDEVLLNIKEVESEYHMAEDEPEVKEINENAINNHRTTIPNTVTNISLSSDSSETSEQNELDKSVRKKKENCVPDAHLASDDEAVKEDKNEDELKKINGMEHIEKDNKLEIKEERPGLMNSFPKDDEIVVIDDDDGELPCSQLFDVNFDAVNVEEPCVDTEKNVIDTECWQDADDSSDSDSDDSDSDAEQWFQRLSQSHEFDSEEDDEVVEETSDKPEAINETDNDNNDEPSCKDVSEKIFHTGEYQQSDQKTSEEERIVTDTAESQSSEIVFRKLPSGSKRKLSVSSDEDLQNAHEKITRVVERNDEDVYESSDSLSDNKKQKKSNNLKEKSLNASHTLPIHRKRISDESDESSCSSSVSKRHKKEESLNDLQALSDSNSGVSSSSNKIEKPLTTKYRHKGIHSTDSDSSNSSDVQNREPSKRQATVARSSTHSSDKDEWLKTIKELPYQFITTHGSKSIEDKSTDKCNKSFTTEIEDEYIFDDVEEQIKPTKIIKSLKLHESPKTEAFTKESSPSPNISDNFEGSVIPFDEQPQVEAPSKPKVIPTKSDISEGSAIPDKQPQIEVTSKPKVSSSKIDVRDSTKAFEKQPQEDTAVSIGNKSLDKPPLKPSVGPIKVDSHQGSVAKTSQNKAWSKGTDTKLNEVSKKISAFHKKKQVPIIEAKSIRKGRKSVSSESETLTKIDVQNHEKYANKHEQWLTNKISSTKTQPPLNRVDAKAYRKEKLKDLAMKEATENKQSEKPKSFTATSKTKTTSKSRNDIFLQDLVSTDGAGIEKVKKDVSLASYKIPRRPSHTEDHAQTTVATISSSKDSVLTVESKPNELSLHNSSIKSSTNSVSDKSQSKPLSTPETTKPSIIDEILKSAGGMSSNNSLKGSRPQMKTAVGGVENEEPNNIVCLKEEDYNIKFQKNSHNSPKELTGILKQSQTPKDKKKQVRFNFSDDVKSTIYITVREFEVADDSKLKPVTKNAKKEAIRGVKTWSRKAEVPKYTSYREETLYIICKWNCSWFEEKDIKKIKNKTDPPVFDGQLYHLTEEFTNYMDYRRGIYPLLMFELWGNVSKHYAQVCVKQNNNTNPLFTIEVRADWSKSVENPFFGSGKTNLCHLQCQVLLDKKQQDVWPRVGDLVVLSLMYKEIIRIESGVKMLSKAGEKRVFGYITDCAPLKPIALHTDVSPKLKQICPNGNMVMDGLKIVLRGDRPQVDRSFLAKFKVVKNIKPDLRVFDAVDRLVSSPLCTQVCQPQWNLLDANNNINQATQPFIEGLNSSQKKAVTTISKACIQDRSMIHLVHGPPGCGKSEVIINIVLQMWFDWLNTHNNSPEGFQQILLCAPSNSAIDDLVNKLVKCMDALSNSLNNPKAIPKFDLIRVGVVQATHESCAHLTLDHLTKMELKRLQELKGDENQKRIQIQCLEARKHQLSQKLDSLSSRRALLNAALDKNKVAAMSKEIRDVEKKLAETKAKIKYFESGKQPDGRESPSKHKTQQDLLHKANIIATTLSSCYNGVMSDAFHKGFIKFDCCIVDEATQCIEADTLIPLILGVKKLVLVGDPKQLPATVTTTTAKSFGLERSLFARHYGWWIKQQREFDLAQVPCHFLNYQYRMHPEIARWPSEHFYENRLLTPPEVLRDRNPNCPLVPYVVLSHNYPQNKAEECNTEEVRLVANLVLGIVSHKQCQGLTIGIITPYNRQKDELRRKINLREYPLLEIGTVDSYQGRERDVVIFSCVRTEGVGFLGGQERLNVALTRAKHSLIVVGNFMSLQVLRKRDQTWNSLLNNAKSRNVFKTVVNNHMAYSLILKQDS